MIAFAADENFDQHIVRALLRRVPELDLRTVQAAGLAGADDPTVLAWAASENRVLLTHDVKTVTRFAYDRITRGEAMPGVIEVRMLAPMANVLEDLTIVVACSTPDDWLDQVRYVPFR